MSTPEKMAEGEIIPAAPRKIRYLVHYKVSLVGELSGVVNFTGEIWRASISEQDALRDVHTFLIKCPLMMYPANHKNSGELITPDFPPEFNGRPLKSVSVWIDSTQHDENAK